MSECKSRRPGRHRILLLIPLSLLAAFVLYVSDYYHADDTALALLDREDVIQEGDLPAAISAASQQAQAVAAIAEFLALP